jgi:hypothetical protein
MDAPIKSEHDGPWGFLRLVAPFTSAIPRLVRGIHAAAGPALNVPGAADGQVDPPDNPGHDAASRSTVKARPQLGAVSVPAARS